MIGGIALWPVFTVIASLGQVARNAMQRHLIERLGTVGATHVRFLYGFPFALLFFAIVFTVVGQPFPAIDSRFLGFGIYGALAQIAATALMLAAMREKSFVVTTAYTKTEPVLVAITGVLVLGDTLGPYAWIAIVIATMGVMLTAWKPGASEQISWKAIALGLTSAAFFAMSAIGFRGAIRSLPTESFVLAATTTLVFGLGFQSLVLSTYLWFRDRAAFTEILKAWKPSLFAGFMGAGASQFWFLAFALETAAKVRTLALIEVLFAGIISGAIIKQAMSPREGFAIALIIFGVGLLILKG